MRLIDADAFVEAIKDYPYGFRGMIVCDIAKQPTIDVEALTVLAFNRGYNYAKSEWNYCPNCGAKWKGAKNEKY